MSIFPKRVTYGENVIIHLRFQNKGKVEEIVEYHLDVYNPIQKNIYHCIDSIILGTNKEGYLYETYKSINVDKSFIPGKYRVNFYLVCRGNIIMSDTKDWDVFYVEDVICYKDKNKIYLCNKSNEYVSVELLGDRSKRINLKPNEKIILDKNYKYYCYGNNKVFPIGLKNESIYQKKCSIKIEKESLFDIENKKKYDLSNDKLNKYHSLNTFVLKEDIKGLEKFFIKYKGGE